MSGTKVALITGITGQDGKYLAELLLEKGYEVHGIKRRSSLFNTERIDHLYQDPHEDQPNFFLHYGDLSDSTNIIRIIQEVQPDEIYNLGAMSHVRVSFEMPEYSADVNGIGTLRILEAIRILGLENKTRFYQASTSELYGKVREIPQNEETGFYPRSPYAVSKLYSYWITVNYRESYGIHASNGILFNHESPYRGETFVTRKISRAVAKIALGLQETVYLGNVEAKRDWGHAKDYVRGMWKMVQHTEPGDFVLATGKQYSVKDFLITSFSKLGISLEFSGSGINEEARIVESIHPQYALKPGQIVMKIDPRYFRPTEVDQLLGDASKAKNILDWSPEYTFDDICEEMVLADLELFRKHKHLKDGGFDVLKEHE